MTNNKPVVLSPSNMDTFRRCPLRFAGQSVYKDIVWKASKAKSRGTVIHSHIEKCLRLGWQPQLSWDGQVDLDYVRRCVADASDRRSRGYELFIEKEMAIDKQSNPCDWWAENALLRAKADAVLLPPVQSDEPALVIDVKTGRKWDEDDFQLRIECLLIHLIWQKPVVWYEYWYVDEGETVSGCIDFAQAGLTPVQDIFDLMREMLLALKNNHYPATRNKFCKWCDYYNTGKCTA